VGVVSSYPISYSHVSNMVNRKIAEKYKYVDKIRNILIALIVVFALILVYQIILKTLGGSWSTENIVVALLMLNLGCTFTIGLTLAKLKFRFDMLASDFKATKK